MCVYLCKQTQHHKIFLIFLLLPIGFITYFMGDRSVTKQLHIWGDFSSLENGNICRTYQFSPMMMHITWQQSAEMFFHVRYNTIYVIYIIDQVSLASKCILRIMSITFVLHSEKLRNSHKLENWAHANIMEFNEAMYKVLHLYQGNLQHKYMLDREYLESSPEEKVLGVLVDSA